MRTLLVVLMCNLTEGLGVPMPTKPAASITNGDASVAESVTTKDKSVPVFSTDSKPQGVVEAMLNDPGSCHTTYAYNMICVAGNVRCCHGVECYNQRDCLTSCSHWTNRPMTPDEVTDRVIG